MASISLERSMFYVARKIYFLIYLINFIALVLKMIAVTFWTSKRWKCYVISNIKNYLNSFFCENTCPSLPVYRQTITNVVTMSITVCSWKTESSILQLTALKLRNIWQNICMSLHIECIKNLTYLPQIPKFQSYPPLVLQLNINKIIY